jgi:hypothetical protein
MTDNERSYKMKLVNNQDGTYTATYTIKHGAQYTCTGFSPEQAVRRAKKSAADGFITPLTAKDF